MKENTYTIKNKKMLFTMIPFIAIFIALTFIQLIQHDFDFTSITITGYFNIALVVALSVITIVDYVRLQQGKIKLVVNDEKIVYHQFFFIKTEIQLEDIKRVELRNTDVAIELQSGKAKFITGFSQTNSVLIIKDIRNRK